jgi:uncharacterized protein (DUF433 family)
VADAIELVWSSTRFETLQLPEFLTQSPDGEIHPTGHRIGLYHLVQHYNDGDSAEMLAARYPTLPLALVHRVLAFYLDNQSDVDAYVVACAAAANQQQRGAVPLDLNALRRRLAAGQPAGREAQVG